MTDYKLQENDVRLLRRMQVCALTGDQKGALRIESHLRGRGVKFILPKDQTDEFVERRLRGYPSNEAYLIRKYGAVWLEEPYNEFVFLNSKWLNPFTLYVRLCYEVPELGTFGKKIHVPKGYEGNYREAAEKMHKEYAQYFPPPPSLMGPRPKGGEIEAVSRIHNVVLASPPLPAKQTLWQRIKQAVARFWRKLTGALH